MFTKLAAKRCCRLRRRRWRRRHTYCLARKKVSPLIRIHKAKSIYGSREQFLFIFFIHSFPSHFSLSPSFAPVASLGLWNIHCARILSWPKWITSFSKIEINVERSQLIWFRAGKYLLNQLSWLWRCMVVVERSPRYIGVNKKATHSLRHWRCVHKRRLDGSCFSFTIPNEPQSAMRVESNDR